jgi:hypothetical protein
VAHTRAALSPSRLRGLHFLEPKGKQDRALSIPREAARRLAFDAIGAHATHATLDETGPHALVDGTRITTFDDERPERTGTRSQLGPIAFERDDGGLEAERPKPITHPLKAGGDSSRRFQTSGGGELAAERLACLTKCNRPPAGGNLLDQEGDQLGQAAVGELDPLELGRDSVDLGRPPGAGPTPAAAPLEHDREEPCLHEPVEARASDVSMRLELGRGVGGGKRIAAGARVHEDPPELGVAGRRKTVERHARNATRPLAGPFLTHTRAGMTNRRSR